MKCHTCFNNDPMYPDVCASRNRPITVLHQIRICLFGCPKYIEESKYCKRMTVEESTDMMVQLKREQLNLDKYVQFREYYEDKIRAKV